MERTCIWRAYVCNQTESLWCQLSSYFYTAQPLRDLSLSSNLSFSWDKRPLSLPHCSHIPDSKHAHTGHIQTKHTEINSCAVHKHKHKRIQTRTTVSVKIYILILKTNMGKHIMLVDIACNRPITQLNYFREAFILWNNTAPQRGKIV